MWKSSLMIMLSMALKIKLHFCSCTSPLHSWDTELLRDKAARQQRKFSARRCAVTSRGQKHTAWTQHPHPCPLSLLGDEIQNAPLKAPHNITWVVGRRLEWQPDSVQCRSCAKTVSVKTRHRSGMWLLSEKLHRLKILSITKR